MNSYDSKFMGDLSLADLTPVFLDEMPLKQLYRVRIDELCGATPELAEALGSTFGYPDKDISEIINKYGQSKKSILNSLESIPRCTWGYAYRQMAYLCLLENNEQEARKYLTEAFDYRCNPLDLNSELKLILKNLDKVGEIVRLAHPYYLMISEAIEKKTPEETFVGQKKDYDPIYA